jgi:hypothetical protein
MYASWYFSSRAKKSLRPGELRILSESKSENFKTAVQACAMITEKEQSFETCYVKYVTS